MSININSPIFWYAHSVFPWYYVLMPMLVYLLSTRKMSLSLKLIATYMIIAMVLMPPHVLVKEFIVFDTYPYSADAKYLTEYGRLSNIHRLSTTPGYAITYAILDLVTNLGIYNLVKAYPLFIMVTATLPMISLVRERLIKPFIPVALFAFFVYQPINFHRATMFIPFMILAFLLLRYNLEKQQGRSLLLVSLIFIAASLTYPMTAILVALLSVTLVVLRITARSNGNYKPLYMYVIIALVSTTMYYAFYTISGYIVNKDFQYIIVNILDDITKMRITSPTEITQQGMYAARGVTNEMKLVTILRLAILLMLTLTVLLTGIVWIRKARHGLYSTYIFHVWLVNIFVLAVAAFFLDYKVFLLKFSYEYVILSIVALASLLEDLPKNSPYRRILINHVMPLMLVTALLVSPLTSYSSLPVIHPNAVEIASSKFIIVFKEWYHSSPRQNKVLYIEYSAPWNLDILVYGKDIMSFQQTGYLALSNRTRLDNIIDSYPVIVTSRFILRDFYLENKVSHSVILNRTIEYLSYRKNLIYVSRGENPEFSINEYSVIYYDYSS